MKHIARLLTFLILAFSLFSLRVSAQGSPPDHRLAARVNVLGVLSFDAIGEVEYLFSDRLGLFVGGGVASPIVAIGQGGWLKGGFNVKSGGAYFGMRIALPFGSVKGFSLKPSIVYTKYGKVEGDGIVIPGIPQTVVFPKQTVGGFLSLAYTQPIGTRFFVEPVVGVGPSFMQSDGKGDGFSYAGITVPMQLNLAFRF